MKKFLLAVMFILLLSVKVCAEVPVWRILWITLPKLNVNHDGTLYKFDMTEEEINKEHELASDAEKFIEEAANNKVDVQITLIDSEMEVTTLTEDTWIHVTEKDFPDDVKREVKRAEDKGHPYNFWLSCYKLEGDSEKINSYGGLGGGRYARVRAGFYWNELYLIDLRIHELLHCFDWFYESLLEYVMPGTHNSEQWGYTGGEEAANKYYYDTLAGAVYDSSNDRYIGISSKMWLFHPGNTHEYNEHTYQFFNIKTGWNDAKEYCEAIGGHLVSISTQEEQAMLEQFMRISDKNQYTFWAGGEKTSGSWNWSTGENFSFNNFAERSSSGDIYLQLKAWDKYGEWTTSGENEKGSGFICEWDYMRGDLELTPKITTAYLPDTSVKAEYSKQLYSAGGNPVSWTVTGLPEGLSCNVSGEITGSALIQGNYNVSVTASNSEGYDNKIFSLIVGERLDTELNTVNFPDETFREYLRLSFDKDNDGWLDKNEISAATDIDVRGSEDQKGNIYSLKGIEYLANLRSLHCEYNRITELDLSRNTRLSWLECQSNDIESLNISGCTSLWVLICSENKLSEIDISNSPSVDFVNCSNNQIKQLDTSKNTGMATLLCGSNVLAALELSNNKNLTWLGCDNNSLTLLDLSNNIKLTHVFCNDNKLVWLNIDDCSELICLYCWGNKISALNIGGCTKRNESEWSFYHDGDTEIVYNHVDITDVFFEPVIAMLTLPGAIMGQPYKCQFTASGITPIIWSYAGMFPEGLMLSDSGIISGTPTKDGIYTFVVTASNGYGVFSKDFSLNVVAFPEILTTSLDIAIKGQSYTFPFEASGTVPITWSCENELPEGLIFSEEGLLSGVPMKDGIYTFVVTASNGYGVFSKDFSLDIVAFPEIVTLSLDTAIMGKSYICQLEASGTSPITWSYTGLLPDGLTLSETGLISGIPISIGNFAFTIVASNDYGTSSKDFSLDVVVELPKISTMNLGIAITGQSYTYQLEATGTTPLTWSYTGKLPEGLTLSDSGLLSGIPTNAGTTTFMVTVSNVAGSASREFMFSVVELPKILTAVLKLAFVDWPPYSFQLTASGKAPITWSYTGSFPAGLTLSETGLISGNPVKEGKYTFTIVASNDVGTASKEFTLDVAVFPEILTAELDNAVVGQPYVFQLTVSGTVPVAWSYTGELPSGFTLNEEGLLSGTPTQAGKYNFDVRASDVDTGEYFALIRDFTLNVLEEDTPPKITTETLSNAVTGQTYSYQLKTSGTTPITWTAKNLPAGLTLNSSGVISGTPSKAGKYTVTVTATNSYGTDTAKFTLQVFDPVSITTASLKAGTIGKSYSVTMRAKGTKTITWSAEGLPNGLSINEKGKISGKSTVYGVFNMKVRAENGAGSVTKNLQLEIKAIAPKLSGSLKKATLNEAYSSGLKVTGSTPITWSIEGNLPDGLTLDSSTGIISGTPTSYAKSGYKITLTATNDAGKKSKKLTLKVNGKAPKITAKLPQATAGENYSTELTATGSEPITFVADLPEYLTLDGNTITGNIPESVKNFKVKVYATNPVKTVSKTYTVKVIMKKKALPENLNNDTGSMENESEGKIPGDNNNVEARSVTGVTGNSSHEEQKSGIPDSYIIVAELGEISRDEPGMYNFDVELPDSVLEGSELVYIAKSDNPSSDDEIVEFYDSTGREISAVPENRRITILIWLNPETVYNPVIAVKD